MTLNIMCAGAVQGIVKALKARFESETGAVLAVQYGAVGALKEALLSGNACDVLIVTDAMLASLQSSGEVGQGPIARLGRVRTGIAVPTGDGHPALDDAEALKRALLEATGVYCPDGQRSTAGIHFASILSKLGIADALAPRLHTYPNGATAMAALAQAGSGAIGCTQITEIKYTPGIDWVGPLPTAFELATVYAAAVTMRAADPGAAQRFVALLSGSETEALREQGGFEL